MREFALYKGEDCLSIGTLFQIAKFKNVKLETLYFLRTPAYKRRLEKRKNSKNAMILISLDDDKDYLNKIRMF